MLPGVQWAVHIDQVVPDGCGYQPRGGLRGGTQGHAEGLTAPGPPDAPVSLASGSLSASLGGRVQAEEKGVHSSCHRGSDGQD